MAAIGADLALVLPYQLDPGTIQESASQIIAKLKAEGVTTVLLSTDPVAPGALTREATAQEYFPEWVVTANTLTDTNASRCIQRATAVSARCCHQWPKDTDRAPLSIERCRCHTYMSSCEPRVHH